MYHILEYLGYNFVSVQSLYIKTQKTLKT